MPVFVVSQELVASRHTQAIEEKIEEAITKAGCDFVRGRYPAQWTIIEYHRWVAGRIIATEKWDAGDRTLAFYAYKAETVLMQIAEYLEETAGHFPAFQLAVPFPVMQVADSPLDLGTTWADNHQYFHPR